MRKVLFINPVGTDLFDREMKEMLQKESEDGTEVEVSINRRCKKR